MALPEGIAPHEPAPAEGRRWPAMAMVVRGAGLLGLATVLGWGALQLGKRWLVAAPVALGLAAAGLLALWAAAIHLAGGEKFDDHPWV